jgi:hypothetical protein
MLHNLKQVQEFLGCAEYHCIFYKNFSTIANPLTCLTKKDEPFMWGPEQQAAQETIIQLITNSPVLVQPNPIKQFELEIDTSQISTRAILYQHDPPITLADETTKPGPQHPYDFHS